MIRIEGEILIDRPVDEVFDIVADERNEPRYNSRILRVHKVTPGPIGLGTRFQAETTAMGRTAGIAIEYTAYQRPRRLGSSIRMAAADIKGALTFDPSPPAPGSAGAGSCGCVGGTGCSPWSSPARAGARSRPPGKPSSSSWSSTGTRYRSYADVLCAVDPTGLSVSGHLTLVGHELRNQAGVGALAIRSLARAVEPE
jgi:hypothetical protein